MELIAGESTARSDVSWVTSGQQRCRNGPAALGLASWVRHLLTRC